MEEVLSGKGFVSKKALVKVTKTNHIVEIQHMEKMNGKNHIKKLDKDSYVDLSTGEIKEFQHIGNRQESYNSLRQTFKKLRYLINNNFLGLPNELHMTLTYKENMTDTGRLYDDFRKFMQRLKRKYKKDTSIDYISVVEPQERGAWHCHLLIRFNDLDKVFVKNKELRELWGQGFVTIKSLKDIDNIGAYLSAYLTDVELSEDTVSSVTKEGRSIETKIVDGVEKKFIKGGRLCMYPPGMNLFRKSKGMIYPERKTMSFEKAKKIVGSAKPHYVKTYEVETDNFNNTITYLQYNLKREDEKSQ
ncbi:rolling circle replication-associated protein [Bacillus cytotoxicus]|uniref:rolling circle replication-associated protein n=1 Tax=Bacillus cytotoxicus TaxID=580165 RepID=UPI003D7CDBE4